MPEGNARKVIAAQTGGAFWAGGLVATVAASDGRLRATLIPTASALLIVNSSFSDGDQFIVPELASK
jgi:hypothetical protein